MLFDTLYTELINPSRKDEYYNHYMEKVKSSTAPEKLDAELKKLESQKELFSSPIMHFLLMAGTLFVIGFIVAIISALTLRRTKIASA